MISKDNGLPLDGVKVEVYKNMVLLDSVYTSKDGSFTSNLKVEGGKDYVLKAVKHNLWADSISVTTPNKRYFINEVAFNMTENFKRNKAGDLIINMKAIYFDSGKWDITKESELSLDKIVLMMNKYPNMIIEVGSHTDSNGNKEANQKLSLKRAMSTAEYIVSHGISSLRISAVGYGDTQPVNNCIRCTGQEDQLNRRTEFVVLKE